MLTSRTVSRNSSEVERQALLSSTAILSNNDAEEEVQQVVPIIGDITRNTEGNMMYIVGAGAILFFVGVVIGNHRLRKSKQIKINND